MAAVRHNILNNAQARDDYARGVLLLKNEFPGTATSELGIPGPSAQVSTYDLFVVWHHLAMNTLTPPTQGDRNAAHSGPVFLPWHRFMLRQLEVNLQRVLGNNNFGLPYWDWALDGEGTAAQQKQSRIWAANCMGGSGSPVSTGPFVFDPANAQSFTIRIDVNFNGNLRQVRRGLRRELGGGVSTLPKRAHAQGLLGMTPYDASPWDSNSTGFRNRLEGWQEPGAPALHNRVHVWVGGDMSPASSPNDPVFYLNHCNVDRLWEAWMTQNGRNYLPDQTAPTSLRGHRINDQMSSLISAPTTPAAVLDSTADYTYATLAT
jgi:tyrosinase